MSYKLEWIKNNVIVIFNDYVDYDDIVYVDGKIYGDSRFDLMNYMVYDFSKVDNFNITEHDLEIFTELDLSASFWNRNLKIAFVVRDKYVTDIISIYIDFMKNSKWKFKIFNELETAKHWGEKIE